MVQLKNLKISIKCATFSFRCVTRRCTFYLWDHHFTCSQWRSRCFSAGGLSMYLTSTIPFLFSEMKFTFILNMWSGLTKRGYMRPKTSIFQCSTMVCKLLKLKSVLTISKVNATCFSKMYDVNTLLKTLFSCEAYEVRKNAYFWTACSPSLWAHSTYKYRSIL